jgi:hypothetical protein
MSMTKTAVAFLKQEAPDLNHAAKHLVEQMENKPFAEMLKVFRSDISNALAWIAEDEKNNDEASKRSMNYAMFRAGGSHKILDAYMTATGETLPAPIGYQFIVASEIYEARCEMRSPEVTQ